MEARTKPTISSPPMVLPFAPVLDVPVVDFVGWVPKDANKKLYGLIIIKSY